MYVFRWLGSLKLQLGLAAVCALALGIGITVAVLEQRARLDTLAVREHMEVTEAVRTARMLAHNVVQQQQALALLAAKLPPGLLESQSALRDFLEDRPVARSLFDRVGIVGADGVTRIASDADGYRRLDESVADRPHFRRALIEQRAAVSEPFVSRLTGEMVVVLAHPLRDGAGVITGAHRLRSHDLLAGIADVRDPEDGGLVMVSDAHGRILSHPQPELIGMPVSAEPMLAQAVERWRSAGSPVEPGGLAFSGSGLLVATAGVSGPDWVVWRSRSRAEVLAPLDAAQAEALHWAAALVMALGVVLLTWLGWLLRPLARLQARAEHLFDGSLDPQLGWPGAGGEIGRLERVLRRVGAERAQFELVNRQMLQQLESVMAAAPVGIAFTRDRRFELVSAQWARLLGCEPAALLGTLLQTIFVSNEDHMLLGQRVGKAVADVRPYEGDWLLLRGDGSRFWGRLQAQPVDAREVGAGTIWTLRDVTEEIAQREKLEWWANHDTLTGLANRNAFDRRVRQVFEALPHSRPAALVVFDLDRFKPVNDRHGHAAGDAMLRAVAAAAVGRVRASDLLARLGGDEFAILMEHCPAEMAWRVADEVRSAITTVRLPWAGEQLDVGASVGVAMLGDDTPDPQAWLEAADRACYQAKAEGRGRVLGAPGLRLVADTTTHAA